MSCLGLKHMKERDRVQCYRERSSITLKKKGGSLLFVKPITTGKLGDLQEILYFTNKSEIYALLTRILSHAL